MSKLRTLKDIARLYKLDESPFEDEIRQEAIKWVKEFKKNVFKIKIYPELRVSKTYSTGQLNKIEWIKHFFNITEKDL